MPFDKSSNKHRLSASSSALSGKNTPIATSTHHFVNGNYLHQPYPEQMQSILFAMGCFWGAEKIFWPIRGVHITAVGYAAGVTLNPTYKEVCSGLTGHSEVVLIVYDPELLPLSKLLKLFWENHDPTQGMRQGNDQGSQYRSGIYVNTEEHLKIAFNSKIVYQKALDSMGMGTITTEILDASFFYFAEEYHQQYLAKNLDGYCGIGGVGISYKP